MHVFLHTRTRSEWRAGVGRERMWGGMLVFLHMRIWPGVVSHSLSVTVAMSAQGSGPVGFARGAPGLASSDTVPGECPAGSRT